MRFISTRGGSGSISFEEVLFSGPSPNGGLYVPESMPKVTEEELESWKELGYGDLCGKVIRKFADEDDIDEAALNEIMKKAFENFDIPEVLRNKELNYVNKNEEFPPRMLLELYHGPTLAFKDMSLQIIGLLFEYYLKKNNPNNRVVDKKKGGLVIIGSTSGDTGSAAMYGLKGKDDINVFIVYPKGLVSEIQELQMVTIPENNIRAIALDTTFDKCQDIVKMVLNSDLKSRYNLSAINSINLVRIICQISYYFYGTLEVYYRRRYPKSQKLRFYVPSGNCGNALAGIYAKYMGLPIDNVVMCININSNLNLLLSEGHFRWEDFTLNPTYTPSMDIVLGSNFERILWHAYLDLARFGDADYSLNLKSSNMFACESVNTLYKLHNQTSSLVIDKALIDIIKRTVSVVMATDNDVAQTISNYYYSSLPSSGVPNDNTFILDPHTAVGVYSSDISAKKDYIDICISTASAAKFSDTVLRSVKDKCPLNVDSNVPLLLKESHIVPPNILKLRQAPRNSAITFDNFDKNAIVHSIANALKKYIDECLSSTNYA